MGVLDDLARARTDYERGDWPAALDIWSGVDQDDLGVEDLRGCRTVGVPARADVTRRSTATSGRSGCARTAGDPGAGIVCAFHLAMIFGTGGEPAMAAGWGEPCRADARRARSATPSRPATWRSCMMYRDLGAGDWEGAAANAVADDRGRAPARRPRPGGARPRRAAAGSRSTERSTRPRDWRCSTRRWWPSRPARSRPRCSATSTAPRSRAARRSPPSTGWPNGPRRCTDGAPRSPDWSRSPASARSTAVR